MREPINSVLLLFEFGLVSEKALLLFCEQAFLLSELGGEEVEIALGSLLEFLLGLVVLEAMED